MRKLLLLLAALAAEARRLAPPPPMPTAFPTTSAPTAFPTTLAPTAFPTTLAPTAYPTTAAPSAAPSAVPSAAPAAAVGFFGSPWTTGAVGDRAAARAACVPPQGMTCGFVEALVSYPGDHARSHAPDARAPIAGPMGQPVAANWSAFWSAAPLLNTLRDAGVIDSPALWTFSYADGTAHPHGCGGGTEAGARGRGRMGHADTTGRTARSVFNIPCNNAAQYICGCFPVSPTATPTAYPTAYPTDGPSAAPTPKVTRSPVPPTTYSPTEYEPSVQSILFAAPVQGLPSDETCFDTPLADLLSCTLTRAFLDRPGAPASEFEFQGPIVNLLGAVIGATVQDVFNFTYGLSPQAALASFSTVQSVVIIGAPGANCDNWTDASDALAYDIYAYDGYWFNSTDGYRRNLTATLPTCANIAVADYADVGYDGDAFSVACLCRGQLSASALYVTLRVAGPYGAAHNCFAEFTVDSSTQAMLETYTKPLYREDGTPIAASFVQLFGGGAANAVADSGDPIPWNPAQCPGEVEAIDPTDAAFLVGTANCSATYTPRVQACFRLYTSAPVPSTYPTPKPTAFPTTYPSTSPTVNPTTYPTTHGPTHHPTHLPTHFPTRHPSASPSRRPTRLPSASPSMQPSTSPTHTAVVVYFGQFAEPGTYGSRATTTAVCAAAAAGAGLTCGSTPAFLSYAGGDDLASLPAHYGFPADAQLVNVNGTQLVGSWNGFFAGEPWTHPFDTVPGIAGADYVAWGTDAAGNELDTCSEYTNTGGSVSMLYLHNYPTASGDGDCDFADRAMFCVCSPDTPEPTQFPTPQPTAFPSTTAPTPYVQLLVYFVTAAPALGDIGAHSNADALCASQGSLYADYVPPGCADAVSMLCYSGGDDAAHLPYVHGLPPDAGVVVYDSDTASNVDFGSWALYLASTQFTQSYSILGCNATGQLYVGQNCNDFTVDSSSQTAGSPLVPGVDLCSGTGLPIPCVCPMARTPGPSAAPSSTRPSQVPTASPSGAPTPPTTWRPSAAPVPAPTASPAIPDPSPVIVYDVALGGPVGGAGPSANADALCGATEGSYYLTYGYGSYVYKNIPPGCAHVAAALCFSGGNDVASLVKNNHYNESAPVTRYNRGPPATYANWSAYIASAADEPYMFGCTNAFTLDGGLNCADFTETTGSTTDPADYPGLTPCSTYGTFLTCVCTVDSVPPPTVQPTPFPSLE